MVVRASLGSAAILLAAGGAALPAAPAAAQQRMTVNVTAREDSGSPAGMIPRASVDKYARLLGLDDDQKAAVAALHEGYVTEFQAAAKEFRAAMAEITRTFEDTQDPTVFREKMPALRRSNAERTKKLEQNFLADVQALLSEHQQALWPKVERQRRRETTLRGALSGESVNLLEIVEALRLTPDEPLARALEEYELDLDRSLQAKEQVNEGARDFEGGGMFDMQAFQDRLAKAREAGLKVREVNQRHARRIEPLLPEERRAEFASAVRRDSFPRVYRPSRTARALEEALKFTDLDASQREAISALKATYERELASANDRWASAIEEEEKSGGPGGTMMLPGGGVMQVRMGDEQADTPVAQARKARRELDERTRDRLESHLRPEQKERLPKTQDREDEGQGAFIGGEARMIMIGGGG